MFPFPNPAADPSPQPPVPSPAAKPPNGRPRALDETKCREVCALISAGCGIIGAARYVGCAASTIRREARRNRDFNEKLRRAHLAAELAPLNALRQAAQRYWRAAAWLLERADAQRYGKQDVRFVKPDQLEEFTDALSQIIGREVHDAETSRRILQGFEEVMNESERETLAELEPLLPTNAKKRKRRRLPPNTTTGAMLSPAGVSMPLHANQHAYPPSRESMPPGAPKPDNFVQQRT
jgi:hypothetical protein